MSAQTAPARPAGEVRERRERKAEIEIGRGSAAARDYSSLEPSRCRGPAAADGAGYQAPCRGCITGGSSRDDRRRSIRTCWVDIERPGRPRATGDSQELVSRCDRSTSTWFADGREATAEMPSTGDFTVSPDPAPAEVLARTSGAGPCRDKRPAANWRWLLARNGCDSECGSVAAGSRGRARRATDLD